MRERRGEGGGRVGEEGRVRRGGRNGTEKRVEKESENEQQSRQHRAGKRWETDDFIEEFEHDW
eukprot:3489272-Rhodomonas_salina.1